MPKSQTHLQTGEFPEFCLLSASAVRFARADAANCFAQAATCSGGGESTQREGLRERPVSSLCADGARPRPGRTRVLLSSDATTVRLSVAVQDGAKNAELNYGLRLADGKWSVAEFEVVER